MKPNISVGTNIAELHEKRKKQRRYFILGVVIVAVCVFLIGSGWLIFKSPIFRIKNITVVGNERLKSDQVLSLLYGKIVDNKFSKAIFGVNNILIWPSGLANDDLKSLPTIKNLVVEKNFLTKSVVVRVEEREPYGVWCYISTPPNSVAMATGTTDGISTPKNCWWFDKEGFIFERSPFAEGSLITVADDYSEQGAGLNSKIMPDEFIPSMFSIFEVLKASGLAVKEIRLNDTSLQEIEVYTYAGPKLYFSLRFSSDNDLQVIQSFLAKPGFNKLQYLDFRVENRAYYK